MRRTSSLFVAKVAIILALILCALVALESGWRIYGLGLALEAERTHPPPSAEEVSTRAAPLLRAAANADPIYAMVQNQHVELHQQHDIIVSIAESARTTSLISVTCASLAMLFLLLAYRQVQKALAQTGELSNANAA